MIPCALSEWLDIIAEQTAKKATTVRSLFIGSVNRLILHDTMFGNPTSKRSSLKSYIFGYITFLWAVKAHSIIL
jgi:hypothetical protein